MTLFQKIREDLHQFPTYTPFRANMFIRHGDRRNRGIWIARINKALRRMEGVEEQNGFFFTNIHFMGYTWEITKLKLMRAKEAGII